MIGETVGNYRITKLLGEGGMGAVYLAEHPGIGRKAAVKVLHPHLTKNEEIANRFFNEARAANAIGHPGIVDVLDFGTLGSGVAYIVMEFLQGESLAARLRRGRLRITDAVEIVFQAASALGAAHAKDIVHRDLKPDNLFLVPDSQTPGREIVKVLDFGIAKLGAGPTGSGSVKTRTGTVMGTPAYMSPEQCRGTKEIDNRTDIYALGIILYEMLCGAPPFVSDGQGELIHLQISALPTQPRKRNSGIPEALEKIVMRALEKDAAQRFHTMGELQQALRGAPVRTVAATQVDPLAPTPSRGSDPNTPKTTLSASVSVLERQLTRRPRWRAPTVMVGLAMATVAAYFVTKSKSESPAIAPQTFEMRSAPTPAAPSTATVPTPAPGPPPVKTALEGSQAASPSEEVVRIDVQEPVAPGLQVTVDGVLGNLPIRLPRGISVAELRFDAPGYQTYMVRVDGSQDRKLVLPMRKVASSGGTRRSRSASGPHTPERIAAAASAKAPTAVPAPSKLPSAEPPAAAEPVQPPARKSKLITDF